MNKDEIIKDLEIRLNLWKKLAIARGEDIKRLEKEKKQLQLACGEWCDRLWAEKGMQQVLSED